jgi:hypothetical protein
MIIYLKYKRIFLALIMIVSVGAFSSCGNAKKKKEKAATQTNSQPSSYGSDIIYKNNFYEAIRLKTVGDIEGSQKILEWCLSERPNDDAVLFLLATYAEANMRLSKAKGLHFTRQCH